MDNILYLECLSGISGDMFVAAMLDLGADEKVLEKALKSLPLQGFSTEITRVKKSGIEACDFSVILENQDNHDHDMEYLYGKAKTQEHRHNHKGVQRNLSEICQILENSDLSKGAKKTAVKIFEILAQAESKVHGLPIEQVHFHEVGAVDSIVDIAAAAVCLDDLRIKRVAVPFLNEGTGCVRCQHGVLPIPVPAVAAIISQYQIPLRIMESEGEYVTPTGAAIVAAIATDYQLPQQFTIQKIGIGAGKRTYERAGVLRTMLIQPEKQ